MTGWNRWADFEQRENYDGPSLRDWQQRALLAWEAQAHRGIVEAITGTGKSLVGVAAIHEVLSYGGVSAVVVPTRALVVQWSNVIRQALPRARVGQLSDGVKDSFDDHDVVVATIQSLHRSPLKTRSLTLLVADEVHRYGSVKYQSALSSDYSWRLGLSGTLERQQDDGVELYLKPYFGEVAMIYGYAEAIRDGTVAPFDLALVETPFAQDESAKYQEENEKCNDARGKLIVQFGFPDDPREFFSLVTKAAAGDEPNKVRELSRKYMSGFSERKKILASARAKLAFSENLAALLGNLNGTLVFSESKDSARRLAYVINKKVPAVPLDSESKSADRDRVLSQFGVGKIKVVCAPRILDEGIDVPEAELAIIASASRTKRQMIQRMGRVIRLKPDGGAARIMIFYVPGTPEDPDSGGYEAFLDEVVPHARSTTRIFDGDLGSVSSWLAGANLAG